MTKFSAWIAITLITAFMASCHLNKAGESEEVFSFPNLAESLAGADYAIIHLVDTNGIVVDTLFNGPVLPSTRFKALPAPHYSGQTVVVIMEGKKDGLTVYHVENLYHGKSRSVAKVTPIVLPSSSIKIRWPNPTLDEGDSIGYPGVQILPAELHDQTLEWISRKPEIIEATSHQIKGLRTGTANLIVRLRRDTLKMDSIRVEVTARTRGGSGLIRLRLIPDDTLVMALQGPGASFKVEVFPSSASANVRWTSLDSSVLAVSADGALFPKRPGFATVVVHSSATDAVSDTGWVRVLPVQPVDSIRFTKDSLEVIESGAAINLTVEVFPRLANPNFELNLKDSSTARLVDGKIQGLREGNTAVIVKSRADPTKKDTLQLRVLFAEKVDSLRVRPDSLRLFVNGESRFVTTSIFPVAARKLLSLHSTSETIVSVDEAGRVTPGLAGKAYIIATAMADSSKKDSCVVIVKKDVPSIRVGGDTVISVGTTLAFSPEVTQEYGLVTMFKWDLDGDGWFDDSSVTPKSGLQHRYDQAKDYLVRFYARDSEGNDTTAIKMVRAVDGRVIQILSPKDSSYTNQRSIEVTWSVDGLVQSSRDSLQDGKNQITRTVRDEAGNVFSATITVYLDRIKPNQPAFSGPKFPVNTLRPTWTWRSGGAGGSGVYRMGLNDSDMTKASLTSDTAYTTQERLTEGSHTLYIQERDEAWNWSLMSSFAIRIDTTRPPAPKVSVSPGSPTNETRPTWNWTGAIGNDRQFYRFKLDDPDLSNGAIDTIANSFQAASNLSEGIHTLYAQVRDTAGNWSEPGSAEVRIDLSPPPPPVFDELPRSPLNSLKPVWTWMPGPSEGVVSYRVKLNDSDLSKGANTISELEFSHSSDLPEGPNSLYIQSKDTAGNWSTTAMRSLTLVPTGQVGGVLSASRVPDNLSIVMDGNGAPFVSYETGNQTNAIEIRQRNSMGGWGLVGIGGIIHGQVSHATMTMDSRGYLYIVFLERVQDPYSRYRIHVWMYNGKTWNPVGVNYEVAITLVEKPPILAFSSLDEPYLSYHEAIPPTDTVSKDPGSTRYVVYVQRYVNSMWQMVDSLETSSMKAFSISASGEPIIITHGSSYGIQAHRRASVSGQWESINSGLPTSDADVYKVVRNSQGVHYLACSRWQDGSRLTVMSLRDGEARWQPVEKFGFTSGAAWGPDIGLNPAGDPIVAFSDDSSGRKLTVMTLENGNWVRVGGSGISQEQVTRPKVVCRQDGVPYVAYLDGQGRPIVYRTAYNP